MKRYELVRLMADKTFRSGFETVENFDAPNDAVQWFINLGAENLSKCQVPAGEDRGVMAIVAEGETYVLRDRGGKAVAQGKVIPWKFVKRGVKRNKGVRVCTVAGA